MISYDKLLKDKGYTTYKIRQTKLIGNSTMANLKAGTGGLDSRTLYKLCKLFNCQPGDLMEYVEDDK